jgi:hypothetical protein
MKVIRSILVASLMPLAWACVGQTTAPAEPGRSDPPTTPAVSSPPEIHASTADSHRPVIVLLSEAQIAARTDL